MKNQYFGDVNDYRKYGLLRILAEDNFRIGVAWMLTPSDNRNDGNITQYLQQEKRWKKYDTSLYEFLETCLNKNLRDVNALEKAGMIPNTLYFSPILQDSATARSAYFMAMLGSFQDCNLLFFDPDNGLEIKSTGKGKKDSSKFLYFDEVVQAYHAGKSLMIYQHFPRVNHQGFMERISKQLSEVTGAKAIDALKAGSVAYFLIHQPHHLDSVESKLKQVNQQWSGEITCAYRFRE